MATLVTSKQGEALSEIGPALAAVKSIKQNRRSLANQRRHTGKAQTTAFVCSQARHCLELFDHVFCVLHVLSAVSALVQHF